MGRAGSKLKRYEEDYEHCKGSNSFGLDISAGNKTESQYIQNSNIAKRKRFGQFFTPLNIAEIMSDWVLGCKPKNLLDPAVGTGILLRALANKSNATFKCDVFDIDPKILSFFDETRIPNIEVQKFNADFLTYKIDNTYDGVIMNPPYLRHHDLVYKFSIHDHIAKLVDSSISKLSNAYVLFVMKACHYLSKGGRGAFIIPSEWTNSNFGESFKAYLIDFAGLQEVIYFTNYINVFDNALTTASILLVEKGKRNKTIAVRCVDTNNSTFEDHSLGQVYKNYSLLSYSKECLRNTKKWDGLFRFGKKANRVGFVPLSDIGESRRGIATGANEYFHINNLQALKISQSHKKPCLGRAIDVKGFIFNSHDYDQIKSQGSRTILLDFQGQLSTSDKEYIKFGEDQKLHERYLLSKRTPWYSMEQRKIAPIWAAVFGRKNLRFIYNQAKVYNLTTFHGFYPFIIDEEFSRALVCCLNSNIVQEFAKLNSRVYGGGLLKFEPKDILDIYVPDLRKVSRKTLCKLSKLLNFQETAQDIIDQCVLDAAEEAATSNKDSLSNITSPPTGFTKAS